MYMGAGAAITHVQDVQVVRAVLTWLQLQPQENSMKKSAAATITSKFYGDECPGSCAMSWFTAVVCKMEITSTHVESAIVFV